MGEVYRAYDARLGRDVAIKMLPDVFAADPERLARFERESRAAAALAHQNVLAIYDVGRHDGRSYLVTELLDGTSLREYLDGAGALPLDRVSALGGQICRGLHAAHVKGIVHRDLKPENVRHAGRDAQDPRLRPGHPHDAGGSVRRRDPCLRYGPDDAGTGARHDRLHGAGAGTGRAG